MIGAPFDGNWNVAVEAAGAMYPAAGSGELLWVIISASLCGLAVIIGGIQESAAYRRME